jgi:hypothetical protein
MTLSATIQIDEWGLSTQPERLNDPLVAIDLLASQVVQQATPLAHHLEQAAARVMILVMYFEVLGEVRDALAEQSDLDLGRAGILLMGPVLLDCLELSHW